MKRRTDSPPRSEPLERRALLSTPSLSAIRAAVGSSWSADLTATGLNLSVPRAVKKYTPDVALLDRTPTLTPAGQLAPFSTPGPVGLTPAKIRRAYGVDSIRFGSVVGDGAGQTIAVVVAYDAPAAQADLHQFSVAFGLPDPPNFTKLDQRGGTSYPPADTSGSWALEASLDLQWAHAMAPAASLVLVEADHPSDADLISAATQTAKNVPNVSVVSMSFGRPEDPGDPGLGYLFTSPAGHPLTFVASTGDSGTPAGFPSYSPNVVAVGGTTLTVDSAGNYLSESGWSRGGGGVSYYQPKPAYQSSVTQSTTRRTVPDVSMVADPATGVPVYDSYDNGTAAPWSIVGGTSLSSPLFAGIVAVTAQLDGLHGIAPADGPSQTLPRLYQLPATEFRDVTTGSNGFTAGPGYDLVTGRGSPIGPALINSLAAVGTAYAVSAGSTPVVIRRSLDGQSVQIWTVGSPATTGPTSTLAVSSIGSLVIAAGSAGVVVDESNGLVAVPGGVIVTGAVPLTAQLPSTGTAVSVGAGVVAEGASADSAVVGVFSSVTIQGGSGPDALTRTYPGGPTVAFSTGGGSDAIDAEAGTITLPAGSAGAGVHVVKLSSLTLGPAGSVVLASATARSDRTLLDVAQLAAGGGRVDVNDNDAIARNGPAGAMTAFWSSRADVTGLPAVAVVNNAGLFNSSHPFDGVAPAAADILVRLTIAGDTNLDGVVDGSDYTRVDFGRLTGSTGWSAGDFNRDGVVDGSDYSLMDNGFNRQAGMLALPSVRAAAAVPPDAIRREKKPTAFADIDAGRLNDRSTDYLTSNISR